MPQPDRRLEELRELAAACTACDLYKTGTQTVFGEGLATAEVMLVGEQPGDKEDLEGRPFVGPAGKMLDKALEDAGIDRDRAYVTNVVKHFKWKPGGAGGKRRIHQKPNAAEQLACRPWLESELEVVTPKVVVCLGATAAQALLGKQFKVTQQHGQWVEWPYEPLATATVHPSSILRAPDDAARRAAYQGMVDDLAIVAGALSVS
ncbi:MAG TPA: UdgX family uracil-DNA binding protein [Acidimicrobiales bacterium]|nr:UdgX family uracil-DNA binding protein [Acidimicrobiales bacterium]